MLRRNLGEKYSPLYFLGALGPGGLAISFFMYLMFLVPHNGTPMAALMHWLPLVDQGGLARIGILAVLLIFVSLTLVHVALLVWNIREYKLFKQTAAYQQLRNSNGEVTLMAVPLTIAMSVNLVFVASSLFIPGLWNVIQMLFPIALLAFTAIGLWSLVIYGRYLLRLITEGNFNIESNTNLSQLLAPFAFSMVAVGLAAPGAMSHMTAVSGMSLALSMVFGVITVVLSLIWLFSGLKQIVTQGLDWSGSPTLWILIPILTLLGITFVRQTMGVHHNFAAPLDNSHFLQITSLILGLQLIIGALGYAVMKKNGYFREFVHGEQHSPASFGLICPGVALVVFGFFFLNYALVINGIIDKYSLMHWLLILPLSYVQFVTGRTLFKLIRRQLIRPKSQFVDA